MTFRLCDDTAAADWIVESTTPAEQLIWFGPSGYGAYARLRFIPDPTSAGQDEADVERSDDHPSDIEQTRRALRVLANCTGTPDDCFFGVWDGYSDVILPAEANAQNMIDLPHRRYVLFRAALADLDSWEAHFGRGDPIAPPALVWPADRQWFFASDVDPHWAGLGGSRAAIDALIATPGLDVVRADPSAPQPLY